MISVTKSVSDHGLKVKKKTTNIKKSKHFRAFSEVYKGLGQTDINFQT